MRKINEKEIKERGLVVEWVMQFDEESRLVQSGPCCYPQSDPEKRERCRILGGTGVIG